MESKTIELNTNLDLEVADNGLPAPQSNEHGPKVTDAEVEQAAKELGMESPIRKTKNLEKLGRYSKQAHAWMVHFGRILKHLDDLDRRIAICDQVMMNPDADPDIRAQMSNCCVQMLATKKETLKIEAAALRAIEGMPEGMVKNQIILDLSGQMKAHEKQADIKVS